MSKSYKKKYQTKSPEEKKAAVQALTKKMEKSIEGYFRSPEDLKEYLSFMGKFYHYSPSNISLIQSQFEGARAVGSFSFWKEKGFSVQKGEKGIQILVPNRTTAKFKDKEGTWKAVTKASEEEKKQIESKSLEVKPGRLYFSIGHVFDVSQTNAKAEDLPRIFPNRWLEGSVEDYKSLYRGMEAIADKNGVKIIEPKEEFGVAKGVSYTLTKEVALNPRNSELQNVKTLLHELAHAKLHTAETHMNYTAPEKEFQAEMTAYTVSSYFGIETSEYSLGYLANWTQGKEMKDKTQLLKEVHETSIEFIETIENTLEKEKEQIQEKEVESMVNEKENNSLDRNVETKNPLITLEALGNLNYLEVARLHVMDNETKDIYSLPIVNQDKRNHDDLRFNLTNCEGREERYHVHELLKQGFYEQVQQSIFQNKGNTSFVIHEANAGLDLNELVKDVRYGAWLEKDEKQNSPSYSEKEMVLYKEMKKEGYTPIASLDKQVQSSEEKEPSTLDKDLSRKYEAYRRSQYEETPDDIDSIVTRVKAEERYYTTKYVSIDNELVSQEHVTKLESQVDEKLGKEGITFNQSTTSSEMDLDKKYQPLNEKQNLKEKEKEPEPVSVGYVVQQKPTKKPSKKKEAMEMER
ncbi:TPA: ImmA/IrrE family metallo-endopeptidase [Bacillus pseudomycoides]|nr:ImmA/IrrE family metallo-endopeptidase [Bacillus pseudomycoides]